MLSNMEIARFWNSVALTKDETLAIDALNLIFGDIVERVAIVGGDRTLSQLSVMVKLATENHPVPLMSLGDGVVRLFGVALALANSRDGFLLIDEVENGIHYSLQRDFWKMVMQTAYANNVQVFATTHSWDCVVGFASAMSELEDVDGALVRLDRKNGRLRAREYSVRNLMIAAEQGIEVR